MVDTLELDRVNFWKTVRIEKHFIFNIVNEGTIKLLIFIVRVATLTMINCLIRCSYLSSTWCMQAYDTICIFRRLFVFFGSCNAPMESKSIFDAIKPIQFVTILMKFHTKCIFIVGACWRRSNVDPTGEFSFGLGKNELHEKCVQYF